MATNTSNNRIVGKIVCHIEGESMGLCTIISLWLLVNGSVDTFPGQIRIDGSVFLLRCVVSRESRRLDLPRFLFYSRVNMRDRLVPEGGLHPRVPFSRPPFYPQAAQISPFVLISFFIPILACCNYIMADRASRCGLIALRLYSTGTRFEYRP